MDMMKTFGYALQPKDHQWKKQQTSCKLCYLTMAPTTWKSFLELKLAMLSLH
ncbi:hypothetical protein X975_02926, partial [Stegodyphus mimosarum]